MVADTRAIEPRSIETKLAAARTRLILDKPFLGALVLRLPMKEAEPQWCPTTATDARAFYYNPEYIGQLSMEETQFMLAHEALHCALSHFARRRHRVRHRWDLACDYAINPLLIDDGLSPPPNALHMPAYKGMTAEEIYPLIEDSDDSQTLDKHAYDRDEKSQGSDSGMREGDLQERSPSEETPEGEKGNGAQARAEPESAGGGASEPEPLRPDEQETLAVQWQQRLAGAAQQAMQAGKLGGELARLIDHLLQPQLPWRMLLARYMTAVARDDYSYMRPSRREGDFILPTLRSQQLELVVAVDTSGSIKDREIEEFIAEVDALKGQVRARISLLPCDSKLCEGAPWVFEPWEELARLESIQGGGGTSFLPVFDWVERTGTVPDLLIYFTDAQGTFPAVEPPYPVIWLVKGRLKVPWGQRVQLN
jgi:predicted metal-dependent peptidase